VAVADGCVLAVEREELVNFIDRRCLFPTISRSEIAEAFDYQAQQLKDRDGPEIITQALLPLRDSFLAPLVISCRTPCRRCGSAHSPKRVEHAEVDPCDLGQGTSGVGHLIRVIYGSAM
jgi:hypothetical protein